MFFLTKSFPFLDNFFAFSVSDNNSFTEYAIFSGFSDGTNNPVSLSTTNYGIPPTFVATTGTFR